MKLIYPLLVIVIFLLSSCGGGSSGGSGNFAGNYLFQLSLDRDECGLNLSNQLNLALRVEQSGNDIVVENLSTGFKMNGSLFGNGWIASSSRSVAGNCTESSQYAFANGSVGALSVGVVCPGTGSCATDYIGTASRQ